MGNLATTEIQRPKIRISWTAVNEVEAWCMKHVGPRLYYLHHKRGGEGWKMEYTNSGYSLELEDPKMMTMAILALGDDLND